MCDNSELVEAASRLRNALNRNSVNKLPASDFQIFIDCTRKSNQIHNDLLQEVSKSLLSLLSSSQLYNDRKFLIATAYSSVVIAHLQQNSENLFNHFLCLIKENKEQERNIYLSHAVLHLSNDYWTQSSKSRELLFQEIFKSVQSLSCGLRFSSFIAFKVFLKLLCKVHQVHPNGDGVSTKVFATMLDVVMCNWENPLSGLRQQNSLVFGQLLLFQEKIWNAVLAKAAGFPMAEGSVRHQPLLELVLTQLSWAVKSKYFMLTAVLQQSDVLQILKMYGEELVEGLRLSLTVPHLVSAGTDLYRAILATVALPDWQHYFLLVFTCLCTNPNISLEMENLFSYWMQHTIKKVPEVLGDLLSLTSLNLYSYVCLLKIARKEGSSFFQWEMINKLKLDLALKDSSDKIRSEALALVSTSAKTSVLPSEEELTLVDQFLRHNINSDNPAFRQSVLNSFTTFVIRIRDSLLLSIKSRKSGEIKSLEGTECSEETMNLNFLNELHSFLLFNLEAGCNYQRKITSLELYKIILTYFGEPKKHKDTSKRKSNKDHLSLKNCEQRLSWSYLFDSESSLKALLTCLFEEDNDIRLSSASILISHFGISNSNLEELVSLYHTALSCCSNQLFYKAESGSLIIHVLVNLAYSSSSDVFKTTILNGNRNFLSVILSSAEEQLIHLQKDLLKAASQGSFLYGTLQTIELLLTDPQSPEFMSLTNEQQETLIVLMEKATNYFLDVLSSKTNQKSDYAPSFGEMGMAIAAVVDSSVVKHTDLTEVVEDDLTSDFQLTPAQQLVLSCVWLNLKQCSKLCSKLVTKPLTKTDTERCISLVVSVLRRCRHKGAIESAGLALYHITKHVTSREDDQELAALPAQLLEDFLESLVASTAATVSRRSAGLAILVHRLITGDSRPKKPLLHQYVSRLMSIANTHVNGDDGSLTDLPQSQALHFLRTLVQESSLREHMAHYTLDVSLAALTNLASPVWTIRNAALQLFGALVPKLVGQKPHQEEGRGSHHLAFEELYAHAKPLVEMMLSDFSAAGRSNSLIQHSKIMPLLTLVTNLTAGLQIVVNKDVSKVVDQFQEHFQQLFKSSIYNVRKLSAKAHCLFLTSSEIAPVIIERVQLVQEFLTGKENLIQSENEFHGFLLNIKYLFERFNDEKGGMKVMLMQERKVNDMLKILSEEVLLSHHSHFVKALVFEMGYSPISSGSTITIPGNPKNNLGFSDFNNKKITRTILALRDEEILEAAEFCLLKNTTYDIQTSCLKALEIITKLKSHKMIKFETLQSLFIIMRKFALHDKCGVKLLSTTLKIMLCILEIIPKTVVAESLCCPMFISHGLQQLSSEPMVVPVVTYLLPVVCGLMSLRETNDFGFLNKVAILIKEISTPNFDQDVRVTGARSMFFLVKILKSDETKVNGLGEHIWEACLEFLQDEITDVRYEASRFVTYFLSSDQEHVWNPYISLESLFKKSFITQLMVPEKALSYLWKHMLSSSVETNVDNRISNPFDHGVKSVYAEEALVSHLAFCCILDLLKSSDLSLKSKATHILNESDGQWTVNTSTKVVQYVQEIKSEIEDESSL